MFVCFNSEGVVILTAEIATPLKRARRGMLKSGAIASAKGINKVR
jgi:hypothetical protein